jgi:hypothetical protein
MPTAILSVLALLAQHAPEILEKAPVLVGKLIAIMKRPDPSQADWDALHDRIQKMDYAAEYERVKAEEEAKAAAKGTP